MEGIFQGQKGRSLTPQAPDTTSRSLSGGLGQCSEGREADPQLSSLHSAHRETTQNQVPGLRGTSSGRQHPQSREKGQSYLAIWFFRVWILLAFNGTIQNLITALIILCPAPSTWPPFTQPSADPLIPHGVPLPMDCPIGLRRAPPYITCWVEKLWGTFD